MLFLVPPSRAGRLVLRRSLSNSSVDTVCRLGFLLRVRHGEWVSCLVTGQTAPLKMVGWRRMTKRSGRLPNAAEQALGCHRQNSRNRVTNVADRGKLSRLFLLQRRCGEWRSRSGNTDAVERRVFPRICTRKYDQKQFFDRIRKFVQSTMRSRLIAVALRHALIQITLGSSQLQRSALHKLCSQPAVRPCHIARSSCDHKFIDGRSL
jgi:hypothetical protein